MSRLKYVILAGPAAALIAACSTSPAAPTPPPSTAPAATPAAATSAPSAPAATTPAAAAGLSGTWHGTYGGAFTGTFTLRWQQASSKLSGTIQLSNPAGGSLPVHGTVQGGAIHFGTVGSTAITYSGTVSGSSMSGDYQVHLASGTTSGTWSASRA
jgi:hypothetical protein